VDAACKMFINGGELAPESPDYPARMQEVDQMMDGKGHCTQEGRGDASTQP
jgi:hypothetical protein